MTLLNLRVFIAIILSLMLTILPLPDILLGIKPPWALLLFLYLEYFLPTYFNIFFLLVIALSLDVLLSTVLGQHVFALSLTTWVGFSKARRFNFFSMGQQMVLIGFLALLYELIILIINAFLGYHFSLIAAFGSAILSLLLWPWLRLLLDENLDPNLIYSNSI